MVRSGCKWSTGSSKLENSIYEAMISAIRSAEHYVYIENQFFITSSCSDNSPLASSLDSEEIKNKIGRALVDKVVEAHRYVSKVILTRLYSRFKMQNAILFIKA